MTPETRTTFEEEQPLFSFEDPHAADDWLIVNDTVMGGVSSSRVHVPETGILRFSGELSLENNGGFASTRTKPHERDLSGFSGLLLRVRGDGRRYICSLRTDHEIRAGAYQRRFETVADAWREMYLPFATFQARSFGQEVDAPPLNVSRLRSVGFTVSDKQVGSFALDVAWVKAVRWAGDG
jgi:monofunctional biosynthetic peptidoglycan transglycosylase